MSALPAPSSTVQNRLAITQVDVGAQFTNARNVAIRPIDLRSTRVRREVEQWFIDLRDPVFRYLRTLRCRHSVAEEITQEAFLRLHRALEDGLDVKDVRAWVFRVARNLCIDSRREHQRYWETGDDPGNQLDRAYSHSAPDPEQRVLNLERIRLIEKEVMRLPQLQRECMYLKAQGLRYHEIAVALGISMTSAVDYVRRAVKRLGRRFSD